MRKWIITIMLLVLVLPQVLASVECQISNDNSTWVNMESTLYGGCIDGTNSLAYAQNLDAETLYYVRCDDTGNNATTWGYSSFTTLEAGGVDVESLAITIFVMAIAGVMLFLPLIMKAFRLRFVENEFLNLIFGRTSIILGLYLMVLNSAIMITIAQAGGLDLTSEMTMFMFLFGIAGYLMMGYVVLKTIIDLMFLWQIKKHNERYGDNE